MSISRSQRAPSPSNTSYSGISRYQSQSYRPVPSMANPNANTFTESRRVAKLHFDEIQIFLGGDLSREPHGTRASAREKLTRLTKQQFTELSTDVYDELLRRKSNKVGNEVPFLPFRQDFHPKRNQARQKLATLPVPRFKDLAGDVYFELSRRYPEFKEPELSESITATSFSSNEDALNLDNRDRTHTPAQSTSFPPSPGIRKLARDLPNAPFSSPPIDRRRLPEDTRVISSPRRPSGDESISTLGNVATATTGVVIPNKSTIAEEEIRVPYGDDDGVADDKYDDQEQYAEDGDNDDARGTFKSPSSPPVNIGGLNALLGNRSLDRSRDSDDEVPRKSDSDYMDGRSGNVSRNDSFRGPQLQLVDEDKIRREYELKTATLQSRINVLEDELNLAHTRDSESQDRVRQLTAEVERLKSNIQGQSITIISLQHELGDARKSQAQHDETLRNDYEFEMRKLQERCERLEIERDSFRVADNNPQLLEQLRSDLESVLMETNELSNRNEELLAARDKDNNIIRDLNSQMKEYKRKYEQAKTELRSLKATSQLYHQLPKQSVDDQLPVTSAGGLIDIHVTAFLSSIDLLLAAGRSPMPSRVYAPMKAVINAVHAILEDVENYEARIRRERLDVDVEDLHALRERAEMTLSNLTAAARTHATSLGMSPVSLLDAAASHVSTTITEIGKTIQIRKATKNELDAFAGGPASPKPMSPTGYSSFRSNDDSFHDVNSRASSRGADDPMSSPPRRVREMSPPRNNFGRNLTSPLQSPPMPAALHAPLPQAPVTSAPLRQPHLENSTSTPPPAPFEMSSNSNGTMASDDSTTSENAEDAWAELKPYLEAQSESIKYAIQSVLSSVRSPVVSPNLNENLTQIITIVSSIVAVCKDSLPPSSLKEGNDILKELSEHCNRLSEIQAMPEITKESRQAMAKSSFAIATGMKSLVKM
ncbi:hypothetical protein Clacol_002755 [Clathrus columnatus]|uniref:GIT Spa2 homology (SHD) domain-containing protein n=1 Tax=Clathrus columnatus TaxID=1419009 RepID=A0AAV5A1N0_9AGAM|nr:hypothetical protein Clacol_002755 [Clathrus columnatus]